MAQLAGLNGLFVQADRRGGRRRAVETFSRPASGEFRRAGGRPSTRTTLS